METIAFRVSHVRLRVKAKIQCSAIYLFTSCKDTALIYFEVIIAVAKHKNIYNPM